MLNVDETYGIHITRGDTARFTVSITNDINGSEYEIQAGDILQMTVKKNVKDTESLIHKTLNGGKTFHIEPSDTSAMSFGKYVYDIQLTTSDGDVFTIIDPTVFEILKEVTF